MAVKRSPKPAVAGREAQRRRTRRAIVDAATALLAGGQTPSVNDVAAAADVSRRTIYLYFPSFDQLLLDATVGALSRSVDEALAAAPGGDSVEARLERMIRAIHRVSPDVERLGRALVRLTVEPDANAPATPRRGYRRMEWIESALAPVDGQLDARGKRRLVCALAMVIGWEALIVQRDVCGLTPAQGEAVSVWAARALLRAALEDVSPARGAPVKAR
jgi:AcrR family transcriptional regulator